MKLALFDPLEWVIPENSSSDATFEDALDVVVDRKARINPTGFHGLLYPLNLKINPDDGLLYPLWFCYTFMKGNTPMVKATKKQLHL